MAVRIMQPQKKASPFGLVGMGIGALAGSPQAGGAIGSAVGGMVDKGGAPEVGGSMGRKLGVMTENQPQAPTPVMEMQPMDNPMQRRLLRTPRELEEQLLSQGG